MPGHHYRKDNQRIEMNPPEVGILLMRKFGNISVASPGSLLKKLFVDLINRSPTGVRIRTERQIEPETLFYLKAFNKVGKIWEVFEGQTKWITQKKQGADTIHIVGAEIKREITEKGATTARTFTLKRKL